ncbi:MAG: DUF1684 domain-containing protein [Ignavibacteria bacterium]|nr:DUF1684 domain-containing protein [Ignavibacteria bacterium]
MNKKIISVLILFASLSLIDCSENELGSEYFSQIQKHRRQTDSLFKYSDTSPFKRDNSVKYTAIKWFDVNPDFVFKSRLIKYENPDTVIVLGTKGEERNQIKYGWFEFDFNKVRYKINVYKYLESDITPGREMLKNYLAVWFRDQTTGKETYEVGRYLEVEEESADPNYLYSLDFNKAYNPYCAYTPIYSCAIPRKEDFIDLKIEAGEKKYHK